MKTRGAGDELLALSGLGWRRRGLERRRGQAREEGGEKTREAEDELLAHSGLGWRRRRRG